MLNLMFTRVVGFGLDMTGGKYLLGALSTTFGNYSLEGHLPVCLLDVLLVSSLLQAQGLVGAPELAKGAAIGWHRCCNNLSR